MESLAEELFATVADGVAVSDIKVSGNQVGGRVHCAQTWLDDCPGATFSVLLQLDEQCRLIRRVVVVPGDQVPLERLMGAHGGDTRISEVLLASAGVVLPCDRPLRLAPVTVAKPWGREIWYTGIERRGVCGLAGCDGRAVPLPWLLRLLPRRLLGADSDRDLVLLKVLDPLADAVFGDLYFELHEHKRELYVVTRVDRQAWPGGVGTIRLGFDPGVVVDFGADHAFRDGFLLSIRAYEGIRRTIDEQLDRYRVEAGVGADEAVTPEQLRGWLGRIEPALLREETRLRLAMERFTATRPLRVGDVVVVPPLTPHSLQHGVRVVEFQSPVYERKILAFTQKVLTQRHWDSDEAIAKMTLRPPAVPQAVGLYRDVDVALERLARFESFDVERLQLQPGGRFTLEVGGRYALVLALDGAIECGGTALAPEEACLVPAQLGRVDVVSDTDRPVVALITRPHLARH